MSSQRRRDRLHIDFSQRGLRLAGVDGPDISRNQRDFLRIVRGATAIGFGLTGGVLAGLKSTGSALVLEFNIWVVPAILAGAGAAWAYWTFVMRVQGSGFEVRGSRFRFRLYTVLLGVGGLLCFLYPMRYVTRGSMGDVIQGVVMAFVVVGMVGLLLWSVARLLNRKDGE